MLIYYNAHYYIEFHKNLSKSWEAVDYYCFGPKFCKRWPIYPLKKYLKIYIDHFCLLMVLHNHAQKLSNQMMWFIFLVMSSRMDRHCLPPPVPSPIPVTHFKGKWILISPIGGVKGEGIWKLKNGVKVLCWGRSS